MDEAVSKDQYVILSVAKNLHFIHNLLDSSVASLLQNDSIITFKTAS